MDKPITIVGGGLAGLTLGIGLRQQNVPVTIVEAGHYPRHRVCGEFISGRGQTVLRDLGLWNELMARGAVLARTAAFYSPGRLLSRQVLPEPALCLSRYKMDACLAELFRSLGGDMQEGKRWLGHEFGDGTIRATGRRIEAVTNGWRWFGLKVHARGIDLESDLELHLRNDGYIGLCRLRDEVNICGLFRARTAQPQLASEWKVFLRGNANSKLAERLRNAEFEETSFCSVAGLSLRRWNPAALAECSIGDAMFMIPPLTGNGMSIAFESAAMGISPLARYRRDELSWEDAQRVIAKACADAFEGRLRWAGFLQTALMSRFGRGFVGQAAAICPPLWKFFFSKTR